MAVVRIGTRGSALALWQTRHIVARLNAVVPDLCVELVEISSTGDEILDVPLSSVEGTGFFTATIERALSDGRVDVAVHSYKDLPVEDTPGLIVAAVPERGPVEDVLCARNGWTLATLPRGTRIGTCSARRTAQVRTARPDLDIRPLRGNVPTRVERVAAGELEAIVLARAGLARLGLEQHITEVFAPSAMLPAPAQGALAVQCRIVDAEIAGWLAALDDAATRRAVTAERTVLHALGGGCSVPVGALATHDGDDLVLRAGVFALHSAQAATIAVAGPDPVALGEQAARQLVDLGARQILAEFERTAPIDMASQEQGLQ